MLLSVSLLAGTLELSFEKRFFNFMGCSCLWGVLLFRVFWPEQADGSRHAHQDERNFCSLTTLGLCLGMALLTSALGLSLSLAPSWPGFFWPVPGYAHERYFQAFSLSGCVFMSLFFISRYRHDRSIWNIFSSISSLIICSTLIFVAVKSVLTLPAVIIQGLSLRTAIITGLTLAQVGEFFFLCLPLRALLPPFFNMSELPDFFFAL